MVLDYEGTLFNARDAAERLGVSATRVRSLAENGSLKTVRYGRNLFVTETSVERYAGLDRRRGRLFSPRIAFAALYMISGKNVDWLTSAERCRLRKRLRGVDSSRLITLCCKRAEVHDYWCHGSRMDRVRERIRLSSASGDICRTFNLMYTENLEGYVPRDQLADVIAEGRLIEKESYHPSIRLHVLDINLPDSGDMPVGVCAADLAVSLDIREKYAGIEKLDSLLRRFREL